MSLQSFRPFRFVAAFLLAGIMVVTVIAFTPKAQANIHSSATSVAQMQERIQLLQARVVQLQQLLQLVEMRDELQSRRTQTSQDPSSPASQTTSEVANGARVSGRLEEALQRYESLRGKFEANRSDLQPAMLSTLDSRFSILRASLDQAELRERQGKELQARTHLDRARSGLDFIEQELQRFEDAGPGRELSPIEQAISPDGSIFTSRDAEWDVEDIDSFSFSFSRTDVYENFGCTCYREQASGNEFTRCQDWDEEHGVHKLSCSSACQYGEISRTIESLTGSLTNVSQSSGREPNSCQTTQGRIQSLREGTTGD